MQKILEVQNPIIRCYPHHASLIACLMSNDFELNEILPYYIQIVYDKDIERCDFNYGMDPLNYIKNYPYVDSYCYKREVIKKKWKTYSEFIEEMIEEDCYIYLLIDTFFVSAYKEWYKKYHLIHDITIYGYDENYFYVADTFENGIYSFSKIEKSEIDKGEIDENIFDWLDGVHCWKLKEKMNLCITMDPKLVKKSLKEYLNCNKTFACTHIEWNRRGDKRRPFSYGLDVYDELVNYVSKERKYLDVIIPYVLCEQKKVLKYIIEVLESQYNIKNYMTQKNNMETLLNHNIILQNLFIKYNVSKKENIKMQILKHIKAIRDVEVDYLTELINNIKINSLFKKPKMKFISNKVEFQIDELTQGNWKNYYGKEGIYIIGDRVLLPNNIKINKNNCFYVSLIRNMADIRGLQRYTSANKYRNSAYYLNDKEFNIEIITDMQTKVSLYVVDYDELKREERIIVQSKKTGTVLIDYLVKEFEDGKYISFYLEESVVISFEKVKGPDAVLSGVFFD